MKNTSSRPDAMFESGRLRFRLWSEDDLEAGRALWCDPRVMQHIEAPLETDEQVLRCIRAGKAHFEEHGVQHFALEHKATGEVLGCCGFNMERDEDDPEGAFLELVIHLRATRWGKGYGQEAVDAALAWAKQHELAARVVASTTEENTSMRIILERAGMRELGKRWYEDTERYEYTYEVDIT